MALLFSESCNHVRKINIPTVPVRLSAHSVRITYIWSDLICVYEYILQEGRIEVEYFREGYSYAQTERWMMIPSSLPLMATLHNANEFMASISEVSSVQQDEPYRFLVNRRVGNGTLGRDGKCKTPPLYYVFFFFFKNPFPSEKHEWRSKRINFLIPDCWLISL